MEQISFKEVVMNKLLMVFMAVLLSFVVGGGVFAQDSGDYKSAMEEFDMHMAMAETVTVEGAVVIHELASHSIVIQGPNGNAAFRDDYARFNEVFNGAKDLKIGAKAKITYKTVDGGNYAIEIERL
jgi:hypothetical protein